MKDTIKCWQRYEKSFIIEKKIKNPIRDIRLQTSFNAPDGSSRRVEGFWDGGNLWRVRFTPDQVGGWSYSAEFSLSGGNLQALGGGQFECVPAGGDTCFEQHGPVRVSADHRSLAHADGTPFFWMADTGWNVMLRSTDDELDYYLKTRVQQNFSVVQWVATQWFVSAQGDLDGRKAYSGREEISVDPLFFQRLDERFDRMSAAGLLSAPVMLWAAHWAAEEDLNQANPGYFLPEDQAILLGRYLVARWGANPVVWILPGDGDYRGEFAERWIRIGRGIFADQPHAPVSLHPGGLMWVSDEFRKETWLDLIGYQSGHSSSEESVRWLVQGPPSVDWQTQPLRPHINLEPCYEHHFDFGAGKPFDDFSVRRALYWSCLVSPTAGVTYGGHGVWGWDDGTKPPVAHGNTGIPYPATQALSMPAANQVKHLVEFFKSFPWETLIPAPDLLASQAGSTSVLATTLVSSSMDGSCVVAYTPENRQIVLKIDCAGHLATWVNPVNGNRYAAVAVLQSGGNVSYETPADGDWLLLIQR